MARATQGLPRSAPRAVAASVRLGVWCERASGDAGAAGRCMIQPWCWRADPREHLVQHTFRRARHPTWCHSRTPHSSVAMATREPSELVPPDDSGSTTFARYCYQAYHAFPLLLECALRPDIQAVVLEHFEDVVVEYADRWRFIQVKTRDPQLGPWKISDLLGESGALHSLYRTYCEIGRHKCTLEAHLEGAIKKADPLNALAEGKTLPGELLGRVAKALDCSPAACGRFLKRVTIFPIGAQRNTVIDRNLRLLMNAFPDLAASRLAEAHERIVARTFQAMTANVFGLSWPLVVFGGTAVADALYQSKRLTHECLKAYVSPLQQSGSAKSPSVPDAKVRTSSESARRSLEPKILPRIRRERLLERFIAAVDRGVQLDRQRIIPIVGPAGYGKSILLGDLYDYRRVSTTAGWVAVVRCDDLPSTDTTDADLDLRFGQVLSGSRVPLSDIVAELQKRGRGVLLIDTLDLILERSTRAPLLRLFRGLVHSGVTIVFTCRNYEFGEYFEPRADLDDLAETIDRYSVSAFTSDESKEAARSFVRDTVPDATEAQADAFAERISDASSDRRSLREIIENPLLLAMLCELHGTSLVVPSDLTVSRLYSEYWQAKVAGSRLYERYSPVVLAKGEVCYGVARSAFAASRARLVQSVDINDLRTADVSSFGPALHELLSDGVLTPLPDQRVRYFHQTLLEYAIARWLSTSEGQSEQARVVAALAGEGRDDLLHWWPIMRQLLSMVDDGEFRALSSQFREGDFPAFRAIALAAGARDDCGTLTALAAVAVQSGSHWELVLCEALQATTFSQLSQLVGIASRLIRQGTLPGAIQAAEVACLAIGAKPDQAVDTLTAAFRALDSRAVSPDDATGNVRHIAAILLMGVERVIRDRCDGGTLDILRQRYPLVGDSGQQAIWRLHFSRSVPLDKRDEFLHLAVTLPLGVNVRATAVEAIEHGGSSSDLAGLEWLVGRDVPEGWEAIQGLVYARTAAERRGGVPHLLEQILVADGDRIHSSLQAAQRLSDEKRRELVLALCELQPSHGDRARLARVAAIARTIADGLLADERKTLSSWITRIAEKWPEELLPLVARLATSKDVSNDLTALVDRIPRRRQAERLLKTIRACPDHLRAHVAAALSSQIRSLPPGPVAKVALVELLRAQAEEMPSALQELGDLAVGPSKKAANAAGAALAELLSSSERFSMETALALAHAPLPNVRALSVDTFTMRVTNGRAVSEGSLRELHSILANERDDLVLRHLCELSGEWARRVGNSLEESIHLMRRIGQLVEENETLRDTVARPYIRAMKLMVQTEERVAVRALVPEAHRILAVVNSTRIQEADVVELLCGIARVDTTFTSALVANGSHIQTLNVRAVAIAIKRVEGLHSPLLDEIMASPWCPPQARGAIIEMRA